MPDKTHRNVKAPKVAVRMLADFMAGSEREKRSIIRDCRYPPIGRIIQLKEARLIVTNFIRAGGPDIEGLLQKAQDIRERLSTDPFERDTFDHNADYISRFAAVWPLMALPHGERLPAKKIPPLDLHGVAIPYDIGFMLRRVTKTNKVKIGAAMVRYRKGKALKKENALFQSALILSALRKQGTEDGSEPDPELCLTIDAYTGASYSAPGDSVTRFANTKAACETIAERWPNIQPPPNAVF